MQRALVGLRGISEAVVNLEPGEAIVEAEASTLPEDMERAVDGQVILSQVRWLLALVPLLGRARP